MTDEELNEIEARARAATPGPWIYKNKSREVVNDSPGFLVARVHCPSLKFIRDGNFIAHVRDDVPALVREVRRLREIIKNEIDDILKEVNEEIEL